MVDAVRRRFRMLCACMKSAIIAFVIEPFEIVVLVLWPRPPLYNSILGYPSRFRMLGRPSIHVIFVNVN